MYKSSELHLLIILEYYTVACAPQTQVDTDVHLPNWYKYNRGMCSCFSPRSMFVMTQWEPETDGDHDERVCTMEIGNHCRPKQQYLLTALL